MSDHRLRLADDFALGALRAQLDALLLLAVSLHTHRLSLRAASESWLFQVNDLADAFGKQIKRLVAPAEILGTWRSFTESIPISGAPASDRSALERVGVELERRLQAGADPLSYLAAANERAHQRTRSLLSRIGAEDLLAAKPARIAISFDRYGGQASASSSRTAGEISWTFQHSGRALWAALAAEPILQHEYLSHLAPRNPSLSRNVREGWLMEILITDIRDGGPEDRVDLLHFKYLRERLASDSDLGDLAAYGSPGLRDAAILMQTRNYPLFLRFTKEMLEMEDGVEQVDEVLQELGERGPSQLCEIFASAEPIGIEGLLAMLHRR